MEIHEVPFVALGGVYEHDDVEAACRVIESASKEDGNFFPLPEENNFQDAFAEHEGSIKAVAVNSCGTALDACMQVLGISSGDEVITSPLTFVATAFCAAALGARVVFADVEYDTLNLDPNKVEEKITSKTKAIIPVHFTGLSANIDAFTRISEKYNIPIIYDAAHAVGSKYRGKTIGGAGTASCYSFQSNKNMTCLGEGGMITTNDPEFAEKARQKKTFGYIYGGPALRIASIGFNYRMTKPQLAVGLTQLIKIDRVIQMRLERFKRIQGLLQGLTEIICPSGIKEGHGCHLYIIRIDTDRVGFGRDVFVKHLKEKYRIGTAYHYPILWSWDAFKNLDFDSSGCRTAEQAASRVVSLPIFPKTSFDDIEYISWAIQETIADLNQ